MMEINLEKVKTRKVRVSAPKSPAPGKILESGIPLTVQAVKEKKAKGETLTLQEKRLLKQEEKQQLGEVIEKKKRLKKEILVEDESNTHDDFNKLADGVEEPVNIDDMSLEHILGVPSPEDDEHERIFAQFGTNDPVEIREILRENYVPVHVSPESITDEYIEHEERKHQEFLFLENDRHPHNTALEDHLREKAMEERRKPWLTRVRNFFAGNPQ